MAHLLAAGGDFDRALSDAPRKDGGFSPLTLAWVLKDMPVAEMASSEGLEDSGWSLVAARDELVT